MQFDITSAYLHGNLKDEYAILRKETWVWRLKKGLYELVQAGRTWNGELNAHMEGVGYTATEKDSAVYVKRTWNQAYFIAGGIGLTISLVLALGTSSVLCQKVWMRSTDWVGRREAGHVDRTQPRRWGDLYFTRGVHQLDIDPFQPHKRHPTLGTFGTRYAPVCG